MLTPENRVLLMQAQEPSGDFRIWFTPGGGMKPDEDPEACLRREIAEETGLSHVDMGPLIWHRHQIFTWDNQLYDQREDIYLVPVQEFEPVMKDNPSEIEQASFLRFKWWSLEEIGASEEQFAPATMAVHFESLVNNGPPLHPIDVGK